MRGTFRAKLVAGAPGGLSALARGHFKMGNKHVPIGKQLVPGGVTADWPALAFVNRVYP